MLTWSEKKPTEPGWYVWFREEYDTMRRKFFIVKSPPGDDRPESLRAFPGNKPLEFVVGGLWYGPIPMPPLADITA